jgi:hypothetical protein
MENGWRIFTIMTHSYLPLILEVLLATLVPALILMIWYKRKSGSESPGRSSNETEPLIEDEAALRAAESQLEVSALDTREKLLKDHILYDRFSTFEGFTAEPMNDLVNDLRSRAIQSEIYFQETLPMGLASAITQQGIFELHTDL